jgi:hypothetical protein
MEELLALGLPALVGAVQGGARAAQAGQNPLQVLGSAAIGGGLGFGLGKLGGGVGTAASGLPAAAEAATDAPGLTGSAANLIAGLSPKVVGGAANLATQSLLGNVPGAVASGVTGALGPVTRFAGGGAGAILQGQQQQKFQQSGLQQPDFTAGTGLDQGQYTLDAWQEANPVGPLQSALRFANQMDMQRALLANQYANYSLQAGDTEKQRDLQRGAAQAALKTALGTQQGLILNGQQQGAAMAQNAISEAGALARTQFNYF